MTEKRKILEVKHLKKYFPLKKGKYKDAVSCTLYDTTGKI